MKQSFFLIYLSMFLTIQLDAQGVEGLDILLRFEKDTYQLLEPWNFKVEVKNVGKEDCAVRATYITGGLASEAAYFKLEIKNRTHKSWTETKSILNLCHSDGFSMFDLKPGAFVTYEFTCPPALNQLEAGSNEFRIAYAPHCNAPKSTYVYSKPITLKILSYADTNDILAYNYLMKQIRPDFLLFPIVRTSCDTSDITSATFLIDRFPTSTIAEYGRQYLCAMYSIKAYNSVFFKKDKVEAIEYLRSAKKYGILALQSKNPLIVAKANFTLAGLFNIAFLAYDYNVPDDIGNEFEYYPGQ